MTHGIFERVIMLTFDNSYGQRASLQRLYIKKAGLARMEGSWEAVREETLGICSWQ